MMMKSNVYKSLIFFTLSFLIVAFSQPAWIGFLGIFAAFLGYFFFWLSIYQVKNNKLKFLISFIWFFSVQSIWLSWMTSTKYQGRLIFIVYFFILFWFALQFGIISYLALKNKKITFLKIFLVSAVWCIFEYSRLFFMCGFSFNQVGLAYANHHLSLQLGAIFGIFGLSFYVIFVNLTAFKAFLEKSLKLYSLWLILAIFPYVYGYFHEKIYEKKFAESKKINVCLVQTALLPEQKMLTQNYFDEFISPIVQWNRIMNFINQKNVDNIDLIALPEAALPFSANDHFYPFEKVQKLFKEKYGKDVLQKLPDLKEPFAKNYDDIWYVANSFFAKALSNIYNCKVAIGLDDFDEKLNQSYNSAFFFEPDLPTYQRYEKQILVPMGEYIPFSLLANLALKKYGIASSFTPGKETKVFSDDAIALSICYEETYPSIMRKARLKGAKYFVNLTNDGYFFKSKLFRQHFDHAKIRTIENGIPLIRACNSGVSAAVDSFGRIIDAIYEEDIAKAIIVKVPLFSYKTIYTIFGDSLIVSICLIIFFISFVKKRKKIHFEKHKLSK